MLSGESSKGMGKPTAYAGLYTSRIKGRKASAWRHRLNPGQSWRQRPSTGALNQELRTHGEEMEILSAIREADASAHPS